MSLPLASTMQPVGDLFGIRVVTDSTLDETRVYQFADMLIIGTRPISWAHREALRIVREGLADVLAYLGEPVHPLTGPALLDRLKESIR